MELRQSGDGGGMGTDPGGLDDEMEAGVEPETEPGDGAGLLRMRVSVCEIF